MTGKRLSTRPADRAERLRRYEELRDQGMTRVEASQEVGIDYYRTGAVYERWYLADRGLPRPTRQGRRDKRIKDLGF